MKTTRQQPDEFPWPVRLFVFAVGMLGLLGLAYVAVDMARREAVFEPSDTREAAEPQTLRATVVKVIDGDTLDVAYGEIVERVRLHGVDCPEVAKNARERSQPSGEAAKGYVETHLAEHPTVLVKYRDRDKYGRIVGDVFYGVPARSLCYELLDAGLAWHDLRYDRNPAWEQACQNARKKRAGLWADSEPPINPRVWRDEKLAKTTTTIPPEPEPKP